MREGHDIETASSELLTLRDAIAQWPSPACVLVGSDHRFVAASESYVRMVGGREVLGRPFAEALPELTRQGYALRLDRVFRTGVAERGERVPVRWDRDGSGVETERFVNFTYHPLRGPDGQPRGVLVQVDDVTTRVLAEEAREEARAEAEALARQLQEQAAELEQQAEAAQALAVELEETVADAQRQRLRAEGILDAMADAYGFLDREWRIVHVNPAAERTLGVSAAEVTGRVHWEVWPHTRGTEVEREYRRAVAEGVPVHLEHRAPRGPHLEIDAYPSPDGLAIFFRDVTERVRAVAALRDSEEQFRTLADSIPHLAWMASPDGEALWFNRRWYEYTGGTWDEMRGSGWASVHDPAQLPGILERFRAALAGGESWEDTLALRGADGHFRWFLSRALPVRDQQGRVVRWLGTHTDVTEQRRMEEEHRRLVEAAEAARAEAEEANRAKSQFLATMSHEIRTPINAIIGYAELLEIGVAGTLTAGQTDYLERVKVSSRHLLGLVNDVLDLSKLDAGGMTAVAERATLAAAAAEALSLVAPQAEARGIVLGAAEGCGPDAVYVGDPDRVRQIVINLLSNAVKFTEPGGTITVRCRATSHGGPGAGDWVVLEVEDTGIGIPAEQLARVFDPFVQVDASHTRTRGGTGLGLAISRDLARLMGGELTARSTPEEGSVFALWLPAPNAARRSVRVEGESPDVLASWAFGPREVPGLAEVGHIISANTEGVVARFGERVAVDPGTPSARGLDRAHREDHFATTTLEIGKALIALDEGGGEPALLGDIADIQRAVAERHGRQRLRHGWNADELSRETQILWEEIRDLVRREAPPHMETRLETALDLVHRLLLRAHHIALASHTAWSEAGASP